jgi:hypothetical protein
MFWPIQLISRPSASSNLSYTLLDTRHIGCDYSTAAVHEAATVYCRRQRWGRVSDPWLRRQFYLPLSDYPLCHQHGKQVGCFGK